MCLFGYIQTNCSNHSNSSSGNFNNTAANRSAMYPESSLLQTHVAVFICLGFLGAAIVLANSMVIFLYRKKAFLQTKTNLCLACLAMSDFLAGSIAVPMVIACNTAEVDILTMWKICTVMDLSSRFISISTVLHLLLVTIERYFMIIHAMHYPFIVTTSRLISLLAFVWCFSLGASLIQLTWIPFSGPTTEEIFQKDAIYSLSIFFGVVVPSLLIMAAALTSIFRVLRRQIQSIKRGHSYKTRAYSRRTIPLEGKAVMVFGSMILTFIVCWFSYFLDGLIQDLNLSVLYLPDWARVVLMFLRFVSSLLNPLLYTFFKEDFKRALRTSFGSSDRRSTGMTTANDTPI